MVTRQLQVERGTGKVRRSKTNVLPLCHATSQVGLGLVGLWLGLALCFVLVGFGSILGVNRRKERLVDTVVTAKVIL